jgi:hypothetical protein
LPGVPSQKGVPDMYDKVTVYNFSPNNLFIWPLPKRTEEQIKARGDLVFYDTAEDVDETALDVSGYYFPLI